MTSREVDSLIATKVLGIAVFEKVLKNGRILYSVDSVAYYYDFAGDLQLANPLPEYSEDITQAWIVLDKLHQNGWFWRLDSKADNVVFTIQNKERKTYMIESNTAARAICEGALQAVGAQLDVKMEEPPSGTT